jgi:hypothetical protein
MKVIAATAAMVASAHAKNMNGEYIVASKDNLNTGFNTGARLAYTPVSLQ